MPFSAKQTADMKVLTYIFRAAREAAEAADPIDDGGTCNFDSPAFKIPRVNTAMLEQAAADAGCTVSDFSWFGGKRWHWLGCGLKGQGNRRTVMMEAATKRLKELALTEFPIMHVSGYYQMD